MGHKCEPGTRTTLNLAYPYAIVDGEKACHTGREVARSWEFGGTYNPFGHGRHGRCGH